MVDVVIPLYNGSAWIGETLESVLHQSVRPGRVIVVDDGSSDSSNELAAGFDGVEVVANSGKGPNAARNLGLAMSNAAYIAFLDQDDVWHEDHLRHLLHAFERFPDAGTVLSRSKNFTDGSPARFELSDCRCEVVDAWDHYPQNVYAGTPGLFLFRRERLVEEGGWPEAHCGSAEYSISLSLTINQPLIRFMGKTLAHRKHRQSRAKTLNRPGQKDWLEHFVRVNSDLMEAFAARSTDPEAVEKIRRRCRMLILVKQMAEAFCAHSLQDFKANRRRLDELAKEEPAWVHKRFCGRFWGLTKRHMKYQGIYTPARFMFLKAIRCMEPVCACSIVCRFLLATGLLKIVLPKNA